MAGKTSTPAMRREWSSLIEKIEQLDSMREATEKMAETVKKMEQSTKKGQATLDGKVIPPAPEGYWLARVSRGSPYKASAMFEKASGLTERASGLKEGDMYSNPEGHYWILFRSENICRSFILFFQKEPEKYLKRIEEKKNVLGAEFLQFRGI